MQKQEAEDQLREATRQLRKLHKTLPVRISKFFKRLDPMRWARNKSGDVESVKSFVLQQS